MKNNIQERGFILVTTFILLAILTALGLMSAMKSNVEIKVSKSALKSEQAFSAMRSGLNETYAYWSTDAAGKTEFDDLSQFVTNKTGTAPAIYVNEYPDSLIGAGSAYFAPSAAAVATKINATPGIRVYTFKADGTVDNTIAWGVGSDPQSAVWITSYKPQDNATAYPYDAAKETFVTTTKCKDCSLVGYAIGRSGDSLRFGREFLSTTNTTIKAFGAMVNAPAYADCTVTGSTTTTSLASTVNVSGGVTNSHMIEATQAPGGVAMASNNTIDPASGSKNWKNGNYGTATTLKGIDPWVIYDPGKVDKVDYPKVTAGLMSAQSATVVKEALFDTTAMDYFSSPDAQLFPLNAYREAANRIAGFTTEVLKIDPSDAAEVGYSVDTYGTPLGNYTALKEDNPDVATGHARMGTLQYADWRYNAENSIPMYGLVRILIPVIHDGGTVSVCGNATQTYKFGAKSSDPLVGGSKEAPDGKFIVYGGVLFDFFYDANDNGIYEPPAERLLSPQEGLVTKKVNVDSPLMFNPVMDAMTPRTGVAGSCDILNISCYPNGSPSWNQTTDAFTFSGVNKSDGEMDLIYDVWHVAQNWNTMVADASGTYAVGFGGASAPSNGFGYWMNDEATAVIRSVSSAAAYPDLAWNDADRTKMKTLLDYYIKTTAKASKSDWSHETLADIEANYQSFYIDSANDLKPGAASAADLYHAFLPSGYVHGWKRGLKVTGLAEESASVPGQPIWNVDLIASDSFSAAIETDVFFIDGYGSAARITSNFADIPAEMYAGGLMDMHHAVNISGVAYTPGQLELEQKDKGTGLAPNAGPLPALQYIRGVVISGNGVFMKNATKNMTDPNKGTKPGRDSITVISYDDTSIDNLPTNQAQTTVGRKYWQELQ